MTGVSARKDKVGGITGTMIGTSPPGVVTSGFPLPTVGAYYQEIIKGIIIIPAIVADVRRHRKKSRASFIIPPRRVMALLTASPIVISPAQTERPA